MLHDCTAISTPSKGDMESCAYSSWGCSRHKNIGWIVPIIAGACGVASAGNGVKTQGVTVTSEAAYRGHTSLLLAIERWKGTPNDP